MPCHFGSSLIPSEKDFPAFALLLSFLIGMAGTGSGEFFDWSVLDGAETVTPPEAETRDREIFLVEEAVRRWSAG